MTAMHWLASYPKSGNTWFRILLANLHSAEPADINNLPSQGGISTSRAMFDGTLMIPSALLTHEESDRLRPLVYTAMARGREHGWLIPPGLCESGGFRFVKSHDAYTTTERGEPLLGVGTALGAALVVRDPRDVAPSLAHHSGRSIDDTIDFMRRSDSTFDGASDRLGRQLRQQLPGWSGFYQTWLEQNDIPVHVIRYEDLHASTHNVFAAALRFAGISASAADIDRAVRYSSFHNLQDQERNQGFRESSRSRPGSFFRQGKAGDWRFELNAAQAARLWTDHGEMMLRFGYEEQ